MANERVNVVIHCEALRLPNIQACVPLATPWKMLLCQNQVNVDASEYQVLSVGRKGSFGLQEPIGNLVAKYKSQVAVFVVTLKKSTAIPISRRVSKRRASPRSASGLSRSPGRAQSGSSPGKRTVAHLRSRGRTVPPEQSPFAGPPNHQGEQQHHEDDMVMPYLGRPNGHQRYEEDAMRMPPPGIQRGQQNFDLDTMRMPPPAVSRVPQPFQRFHGGNIRAQTPSSNRGQQRFEEDDIRMPYASQPQLQRSPDRMNDFIDDDAESMLSQDSQDDGTDAVSAVVDKMLKCIRNGDMQRIRNELRALKSSDRSLRVSRYMPLTMTMLYQCYLD